MHVCGYVVLPQDGGGSITKDELGALMSVRDLWTCAVGLACSGMRHAWCVPWLLASAPPHLCAFVCFADGWARGRRRWASLPARYVRSGVASRLLQPLLLLCRPLALLAGAATVWGGPGGVWVLVAYLGLSCGCRPAAAASGASQEEITLMINEIDLDNDGEIDFEGVYVAEGGGGQGGGGEVMSGEWGVGGGGFGASSLCCAPVTRSGRRYPPLPLALRARTNAHAQQDGPMAGGGRKGRAGVCRVASKSSTAPPPPPPACPGWVLFAVGGPPAQSLWRSCLAR